MSDTKILVVEDDAPVRNLITTTLEINGYSYQTAGNAQTALMLTTSDPPDIIFMDLGLPDLDGVEVIRKIRGWSNVPIIVISARSEDADKIAALDAGADDYLTKPFSVEELLASMDALTDVPGAAEAVDLPAAEAIEDIDAALDEISFDDLIEEGSGKVEEIAEAAAEAVPEEISFDSLEALFKNEQ